MSSLDRNIVVGEDLIQPSNSVRSLGVQFDYEMNMRVQIAKTYKYIHVLVFSTYDVYVCRFEEFWDVSCQQNWFRHL